MSKSPYLPETVKIKKIKQETADIKTFTLIYKPNFIVGRFFEIGITGVGEAPFTPSSIPGEDFEMSVKKIGSLTSALHNLKRGDKVTIRGPYGDGFPYDKLKGKNLLFIGGGIGLPPLKSLISLVLKERGKFGRINILYGARDETQIVSKEYLSKIWPKRENIKVEVCVDCKKGKCLWPEHICLIPDLIDIVFNKNKKELSNTITIVCGPPIMIKFVIKKLLEYDVKEEDIITTLERQMRCGIGKCGHCNIGERYVCLDGPVFNYKEIKKFIEEF